MVSVAGGISEFRLAIVGDKSRCFYWQRNRFFLGVIAYYVGQDLKQNVLWPPPKVDHRVGNLCRPFGCDKPMQPEFLGIGCGVFESSWNAYRKTGTTKSACPEMAG